MNRRPTTISYPTWLLAWLVYATAITLAAAGLLTLITAGERAMFVAWLATIGGAGAAAFVRAVICSINGRRA